MVLDGLHRAVLWASQPAVSGAIHCAVRLEEEVIAGAVMVQVWWMTAAALGQSHFLELPEVRDSSPKDLWRPFAQGVMADRGSRIRVSGLLVSSQALQAHCTEKLREAASRMFHGIVNRNLCAGANWCGCFASL